MRALCPRTFGVTLQQYLEENVDKTYLDVGIMTKHLQDRYPEYARRKIAPFRALVEQGKCNSDIMCYSILLKKIFIFSLSRCVAELRLRRSSFEW